MRLVSSLPGKMTSPRLHLRRSPGRAVAFLMLGCSALGCASQKQKPIVPEGMQERSKERYGEQEMMMNSLNQTPAEQASTLHHRDTAPPPADRGQDRDGRDSGK